MQKMISRYRDMTELKDGGEIPTLHGIRALMVLFVVAFHFWQQSWLTPSMTLLGLNISFEPLLRSGYMWVDGLLLLSGFLCYLPYATARETNKPNPLLGPFYRRRFFRIVPSYVFNVLVMLLFVALPRGLYRQPGDAALDVLAHLTFTHNFFRFSYFATPLNGVLWTLAVEVQFYLVFPFLAKAFRKMPLLCYSLMTGAAFLFRFYAAGVADNPLPFESEDLSFGALDFFDTNPEKAVQALGKASHDERVKESDTEQLRIMQWDGVEIAFSYNAKGEFNRTERLFVSLPGIEGPRGLRIGTDLMGAINSFPHEGEFTSASQMLYGNGEMQVAPYGRLETQGSEAQLYYAAEQNGQTVLLSLEFIDGVLVNMGASY